jgi:hypothetical protein
MSDHHNLRKDQESSHSSHPFWKRAHLDWRFWAVLLLMLAAMTMYVMSDNESLRFGRRSEQPQSAVGEK